MTEEIQDRLSVRMVVRLNPPLYKVLDKYSWQNEKSSAQVMRDALCEYLENRGHPAPRKLTMQQWLDKQRAERLAREAAESDDSIFPKVIL